MLEAARATSRPAGFFVAGEFGHLREVIAEVGIPGFELRQQFVADAIAGEGEMAVGGVFAPGLVEGFEEGFDLGAGGGEERAEDAALGEVDDGVDAGEAFGPCAAKELGEDGFGLVVEGVRGGDGVDWTGGHELAEPGVAQAAGGFFDGVGGFSGGGIGGGEGGSVDAETRGRGCSSWRRGAARRRVGIGFIAAKAVVEMGDVEDEAQFPALRQRGRAGARRSPRRRRGRRARRRPGLRGVVSSVRLGLRGRWAHEKMIRRAVNGRPRCGFGNTLGVLTSN